MDLYEEYKESKEDATLRMYGWILFSAALCFIFPWVGETWQGVLTWILPVTISIAVLAWYLWEDAKKQLAGRFRGNLPSREFTQRVAIALQRDVLDPAERIVARGDRMGYCSLQASLGNDAFYIPVVFRDSQTKANRKAFEELTGVKLKEECKKSPDYRKEIKAQMHKDEFVVTYDEMKRVAASYKQYQNSNLQERGF